MIHHALHPRRMLAAHTCGHAPHLIEARGHTLTDPRLLGKPARLYHVECCRCGIATVPVWTQRTAEHLWAAQAGLIPVTQLQALRIDAERGLLNAA